LKVLISGILVPFGFWLLYVLFLFLAVGLSLPSALILPAMHSFGIFSCVNRFVVGSEVLVSMAMKRTVLRVVTA
jgi:hypothetical protein